MTTTVRDCEQIADCIVAAAFTDDRAGIDGMLTTVTETELLTTCLILGRWLADEIESHR